MRGPHGAARRLHEGRLGRAARECPGPPRPRCLGDRHCASEANEPLVWFESATTTLQSRHRLPPIPRRPSLALASPPAVEIRSEARPPQKRSRTPTHFLCILRRMNVLTPTYPTLGQRLGFLLVYGLGLYFAGWAATGSPMVTGGGEWLWWLSALALYLINTLQAPFFNRPRDTLASCVVSASMLFTVDLKSVALLQPQLQIFRQVSFVFTLILGILAAVSIAIDTPRHRVAPRSQASQIAYRLSVQLGNATMIFTLPVLISIFGFYQNSIAAVLWLSALWIFIVAAKPVEMLWTIWTILKSPKTAQETGQQVGEVTRVDDPNIIRVKLSSAASWRDKRPHTARLPGDRSMDVIPLFLQAQDYDLIGTGLCLEGSPDNAMRVGQVFTAAALNCDELISKLAGTTQSTDLIGFLVEESNIASIRFEVAKDNMLQEGTVVFVRDRSSTIYYQVLDAINKEELFASNPRGTQIAHASQLGVFNGDSGFTKYGWLPPMNSPVFLPKEAINSKVVDLNSQRGVDEFCLGVVAQSGIRVVASLSEMADYHTAILGVTGAGKTELVFDIIRAQVNAGRKVFCVDCTGEYQPRLIDLSPQLLGFTDSSLSDLDGLVNATEHGNFGAGDEKKALHQWVSANREQVQQTVAAFMENDEQSVGIFELPDIANTRATLRATEMYITAVFAWAKAHRRAREVLVVLEEAHTVVPEWNLFRYDKADTDSVVGRMAQIALQGRKYGVGLLLVSQRTALVSKTLLSQCNTCITFAMYDKTGLDYLASVFASEHVRAIPNLRFLQGVAFGKAVKSERPVIFDVPFDPTKREASEALNVVMTRGPQEDKGVSDEPERTVDDEIQL